MRKTVLAMAASLPLVLATQASAQSSLGPSMDPTVVEAATSSSGSHDALVPIMLMLVLLVAVTAGGGGAGGHIYPH